MLHCQCPKCSTALYFLYRLSRSQIPDLSDWAFFGWKIVKCTFLQTNYLSLRKAMNNSEWETDPRTLQSAHKQEKFLGINNWLGISQSIPLVTKSFSKEELAYRETIHRYAPWIEYLNLSPWKKILLFIERWTGSKYREHWDAQLCYQSRALTGEAECRSTSGGTVISLPCSRGTKTLLLAGVPGIALLAAVPPLCQAVAGKEGAWSTFALQKFVTGASAFFQLIKRVETFPGAALQKWKRGEKW